MKIYTDLSIMDFKAWSGAKYTQKVIIEKGLEEEFDYLIDELYPRGLSSTELNDILWFESEWIFESLGIEVEE